MGRQKSDGRMVPEGRRKAVRAGPGQQGKATTVSKQSGRHQVEGEAAANRNRAGAARTPNRVGGKRAPVVETPSVVSPLLSPMTMEEIAREANLRMAFDKVAKNRGAPGPDRQSIEEVRQDLRRCLRQLRQSLLDGSYRPGDIRRVWIPKANGEQRGLGIPNVVDRIVQQAVLQVLSPHYETTFHKNSHGFRPGRSCHTAIKQAKKYVEQGYEWVVDLDLEKFFDRVHHDRLMSRLEQRITDRGVLTLIRRMLRANVVLPDGVVVTTEAGAPQGGPLSPLLSNIVLDELDQELEKRGLRFVRYADDSNIYVRSERAGRRVMASISRFIEKRLKLKVNAEKSKVIKPVEGSFLGLTLRRLKNGKVYVLVSDKALDKLESTLKAMTPRNWGQSLDACIQRLNRYLRGWLGYYAICDEKHHARLGRIDAHLRRRLRAMRLKQWKRKKHIVPRLEALGVPPVIVRIDIHAYCPSWWALSRRRAVSRGLSNEYFRRRGLFSLHDHWRRRHEKIWGIGSKATPIAAG